MMGTTPATSSVTQIPSQPFRRHSLKRSNRSKCSSDLLFFRLVLASRRSAPPLSLTRCHPFQYRDCFIHRITLCTKLLNHLQNIHVHSVATNQLSTYMKKTNKAWAIMMSNGRIAAVFGRSKPAHYYIG